MTTQDDLSLDTHDTEILLYRLWDAMDFATDGAESEIQDIFSRVRAAASILRAATDGGDLRATALARCLLDDVVSLIAQWTPLSDDFRYAHKAAQDLCSAADAYADAATDATERAEVAEERAEQAEDALGDWG